MPESKLQEFKKPIILVAILLFVLILFIFNRSMFKNGPKKPEQSVGDNRISNNFMNNSLDTEILNDNKFKELKPIPKYQYEGINISDNELANARKRYGNPFKPFD